MTYPRTSGYISLLDVCDEEVHHDLPSGLFEDTSATERAKMTLEETAKDAAERAAKNAGVAPQLLYAPILWALQDAEKARAA